jgi:alpha-tubulin suppressor-like RCC1 family protein
VRKITGILLVLCLLAVFMSIPASAAFSIEPAIAVGGNHSVALDSKGIVWAWGDNNYGQLGDGTRTRRTIPVQVPSLREVTAIAAGSNHTVALKSDGTVWAWGQNAHGQLGNGTTVVHTSPVQVVDLEGAVAIASHDNHTLALKNDGTVWAWGDNSRGQLGHLRWGSSPSAQLVEGLEGVTAIAAGWGHSLALREDGSVWAWGCLQLGIPPANPPPTAEELLPRKIEGIDNVSAIAAGGKNAAAIRSDGTVWTWENDSETPVQVQGLSGISKVAVGANHMFALKADGTLWAWGDNKFGQLGDGTIINSDLPVQLMDFAGVTAIAAHDHSLALKSDGVVWAWGSNEKGQLGNDMSGADSSSSTPVQVQSPFQRGLLKDNVLNLFDTAPWWRSLPGFIQLILRYFFFGWLWM